MTSVELQHEKTKELIYKFLNQDISKEQLLIQHHHLLHQIEEVHRCEIINAVDIPKAERWYDSLRYNSAGEQYYNEKLK